MPALERIKTDYQGVFYINSQAIGSSKDERIYYIRYRKNKSLIEEKIGRQFQDNMTPAKAARIRAKRIEGELSNHEVREEQKAAKYAETSRWTIEHLWNEYISQKKELRGQVTDKNRFKLHIQPVFGHMEPGEIAPLDIDRFRINLLKKKKPGTVKNVMELLRRIINFGINRNLCDGLSFRLEMPRVDNTKTETLTIQQLTDLLEAIENSPHRQAAAMLKLVLYTGMRRGEIFKLQWKDIDFENGFISIRQPKGGKDSIIPMNEPARELLSSIEKTENPYLFPSRKGGPKIDAKKQLNPIKLQAKLPTDFRIMHGLRHVYASNLVSNGVDLYTVSKLLTHKSTSMTARYAHLSDAATRQASELAGKIVKQADEAKMKGQATRQRMP